MKTNVGLSLLLLAIAALVAALGLGSAPDGERATPFAAASWSSVFPVAQAGFATPVTGAH